METNYEVAQNQISGDVMWKINDTNLAITDCGKGIMKQFIEQYKYDEYTLSIYDEATNNTIEIEAGLNDMPKIVSDIYRIEHATPLSFIGINFLSDSYVVGMTLAKGHIEFGCYKYIDGTLNKID